MDTPSSIVTHLFPLGTRGNGKCIKEFPVWPPDLFAVTSYILQMSDAYTALMDHSNGIYSYLNEHRDTHITIAKLWSEDELFIQTDESNIIKIIGDMLKKPSVKNEVWSIAHCWELIVENRQPISQLSNLENPSNIATIKSLLQLLIISDYASTGLGFYNYEDKAENTWVQTIFYAVNIGLVQLSTLQNHQDSDWVVNAASKISTPSKNGTAEPAPTACIMIPKDYLCVLPKTRTPNVGCTLRSLSHHLALLPGAGQVAVRWNQHSLNGSAPTNFNILFIPYPLSIDALCFSQGEVNNIMHQWTWEVQYRTEMVTNRSCRIHHLS